MEPGTAERTQLFRKDDFSKLGTGTLILRDMSSEQSFSVSLGSIQTFKSQDHGIEPFSVSLMVSTEKNLTQGIYQLDHPSKGLTEIFLVPVARHEKHLELEAVFN